MARRDPARHCSHFIGLGSLVILLLATTTVVADPGDVPETPYLGTLHVLFTCSMPPFMSEATMDVEILGDGSVEIGFTTMTYGGSIPVDEDCMYERQGSWEIVPIGTYESGPPCHLAVDENVAYHEHIALTCPGYTIENDDDGNLNGGLAFDITEATIGGAEVAVTTETGDAIVWTLNLTPQLPVEPTSWSRVKARYHD
jgi:hypothetical protein